MNHENEVMSTRDRLVYMANQIARNFAAIHQDDAVEALADHIASFWDPRMRTQITQVWKEDPARLCDVARAGIGMLRQEAPSHQTGATIFNTVDEAGHSDAG